MNLVELVHALSHATVDAIHKMTQILRIDLYSHIQIRYGGEFPLDRHETNLVPESEI